MISRAVYPKQRGRRWMAALSLLVLVSGTLLVGSTALAVHSDGLFELDTNSSQAICTPVTAPCGDANVADSPAGGADDWADVFNNTDVAFGSTFIPDPVGDVENSYFTGGGSKDERDIPDWQYATANDVVPDKDDIAHAFAAAYVNPADNHTHIYFGDDRFDNNGSAETGFWFFQNRVALGANGRFTGTHRVGDVLVLANWGGSNPVGQVTVYQWVGGRSPLALVFDSTTADCAKVGVNDNVCAVVNRQNVAQPWGFLDKSGSTVIRPLELFEAGLDVTALFGADRCFASFLANTRSSHSTTAQLKDFALGGFEQCGASISISPSAVNEVGESHTFTVNVSKTVAGAPSPAAGVFPTVTLTTANGAVVANKVDNCATTGTDASGNCTVTFTSNSAGTVTGNASATVTIGTETFNVSTDGVSPNSGPAVKRFVDARIAIAPDDVNEINENHTFTVTVAQNLGLGVGFVAPAAGTAVTVSLTDANGSTVQTSANTCASPGTTAAGTCTVTFTSPTAGLVTGNASVSLSLDGQTVVRDTAGTAGPGGSDGADKRFVDAFITINPPLATNTVGDPHTFTVNVQQNSGNGAGFVDVPDGTIVTVTLTPSAGATISLIDDTCDGPGTVGGECTVTFTSSTSGTVTGHASVNLTIQGEAVSRQTDGIAPNSGDAVKHFVAGSIAWTKVDNAGALQGGATFQVCQTHTFTLPSGPFVDLVPDACVTVADNGAVDQDPANGKFLISGLSLGRYTVKETIAPLGFVADPDTVTVELTPGNTEVTISEAFVNSREVLKITGFGYTNAPVGTPTSGVVHGTAVFTVTLHNYGTAVANLTNSSLVVTGATCTGGNTLALTGTIAAGADSPTYTLTCVYNAADGAIVQADLVVKSITNGLTREASGSPARITFTVQAD